MRHNNNNNNNIQVSKSKAVVSVNLSESKPSVLFDLPLDVQRRVFSYLSFDELSRYRLICRQINKFFQQLLNEGFKRAESSQMQLMQRVKVQLPRRESERRRHPFSRHADVLTAVETRLSLLSMTFKKYLDLGVCCFIPGKVLDEVYSVLKVVQRNLDGRDKSELKPHEILQELRDISSMAMEHFDEKILPKLRQSCEGPRMFPDMRPNSPSSSLLFAPGPMLEPGPSASSPAVAAPNNLKLPALVGPNSAISKLEKQLRTTNAQLAQYKAAVTALQDAQKRHKRQISQQSRVITEQGGQISEINRKLLEYDNRFAELLADVRIPEGSAPGTAASTSKSPSTLVGVLADSVDSTTGEGPGKEKWVQKRKLAEDDKESSLPVNPEKRRRCSRVLDMVEGEWASSHWTARLRNRAGHKDA